MRNIYVELNLIKKQYALLQEKKNTIQDEIEYAMISTTDAAKEVANLNKKERILIKKAIELVHVTNDGSPRAIKYIESKGMYYTNTPDRKQVWGKTLESLYENLFNYYGLSIEKQDITVGGVFKKAFERKQRLSTNKENSLKRNLNTFKTYFTSEFAKRDITKITKDDLLAYTKSMCEDKHPSKKEFLAYKGILNLIFEYAFDNDIRSDNPVPCIHNEDYYKDGYCDCITRESEDNILSEAQIEDVRSHIKERNATGKFKGYDITGLAIILSTYTGMRVGEICALRWNDIKTDWIWIHAQIVEGERKNGEPMKWVYCPYTKNERKKSTKRGRHFPINNAIRELLDYIRTKQIELRLYDEDGYVFTRTDGTPINPNSYTKSLKKMMDKLGYKVTNNHAFRKSLNSNILIPMGLDEVQRAELLGHSTEVNINNYTYKRIDDDNEIISKFTNYTNTTTQQFDNPISLLKTRSRQKVVEFNEFKQIKTTGLAGGLF